MTGGALGLAGAITFFVNAGSFFFFVDRASAYAQCSSCLQLAYSEALGSQSFTYGFQLAYLLISIAVGLFSLVVKSADYKLVRITGLATAAFGVFESIGFIAAQTSFDSSVYDVGVKNLVNNTIFIVGVIALILFVLWALIIGQKMRHPTASSNH